MMALFAIAALGMTVACEKSDKTDDGNGDTNASIVGTWKVVGASDGDMTIPGIQNMNLSMVMNENCTGEVVSAQMTLGFNWALNGTTLTITTNGNGSQVLSYTVTKLTATQCVIKGTVVPVVNYVAQSADGIRLDLERDPVNPNPNPNPNDTIPTPNPNDTIPTPNPEAFPAATNWVLNYTQSFTIDTMDTQIIATVNIEGSLNFNATGNTGVMNYEGEVTGMMAGIPIPMTLFEMDPTTINFTYTFDSTTNTGTMTGSVDGVEDETIPFSYDPQTDRIAFPVSAMIDDNDIPQDIPEGIEIPTVIYFTRAN